VLVSVAKNLSSELLFEPQAMQIFAAGRPRSAAFGWWV
jgi:hypothetical protein